MTKPSKQIQSRFDRLVENLQGPVPKDVLANFLFGDLDPSTGMPAKPGTSNVFSYSERQISRILHIAEDNLRRVQRLPLPEQPELIACGGGPGSGKSTTLFQAIEEMYGVGGLAAADWTEPSLNKVIDRLFLSRDRVPAALSAPDRKALLQIALHDHAEPTSNETFYLHNRAASNFLSLFEMDAAITHKKNLVWDTTLGSAGAVANLKYAKENGYKIAAILQGAPLETREEAVNARNKDYFQSLKMNLTAQEEGFAKAMAEVVALANTVALAWRDEANKPAIGVATLLPAEKQLIVYDRAGFDKLRAMYPQIDSLGFQEVARPTKGGEPAFPAKKL